MILYGIPNCDTIKKARAWLEARGVDYRFHDYKKQGIDEATLRAWCRELSADELINRRGTTWRKLDEAERQDLDADGAVRLMQRHPSLIKRPLLDTGRERIVGFDPARYEALLR